MLDLKNLKRGDTVQTISVPHTYATFLAKSDLDSDCFIAEDDETKQISDDYNIKDWEIWNQEWE